jgi:hypothetical protein
LDRIRLRDPVSEVAVDDDLIATISKVATVAMAAIFVKLFTIAVR